MTIKTKNNNNKFIQKAIHDLQSLVKNLRATHNKGMSQIIRQDFIREHRMNFRNVGFPNVGVILDSETYHKYSTMTVTINDKPLRVDIHFNTAPNAANAAFRMANSKESRISNINELASIEVDSVDTCFSNIDDIERIKNTPADSMRIIEVIHELRELEAASHKHHTD